MQVIRNENTLLIATALGIFLSALCGLNWVVAADDKPERPNPPGIDEAAGKPPSDVSPATNSGDRHETSSVAPENLIQVTDHVLSGGAIESREGFDWLASQGVTMVVSVDGFPPHPYAQAIGLRRIHIPIGYEGIPRQAQLALCRAASEADGKIYVHCHHGVHRGPAAAAMIGRASGKLNKAAAADVLRQAGTDSQFEGLWRDVAAFRQPGDEEPVPDLVAEATLPELAESMAHIGRLFDSAVARAEVAANADEQTSEATLNDLSSDWLRISEFFRESARFESVSTQNNDLADLLRAAAEKSSEIQQSLKKDDVGKSLASIAHLRQMCAKCHDDFRN